MSARLSRSGLLVMLAVLGSRTAGLLVKTRGLLLRKRLTCKILLSCKTLLSCKILLSLPQHL